MTFIFIPSHICNFRLFFVMFTSFVCGIFRCYVTDRRMLVQVSLLKKVLTAWRTEVQRQPCSMSADEAYADLDLATGERHRDEAVRHAYLKLAQKFHPDKNPTGRVRIQLSFYYSMLFSVFLLHHEPIPCD